jgi:hypothetical protein
MLPLVIVLLVVLRFHPCRTPPAKTASGYMGGYICPAGGLNIAPGLIAEALDASAPKLLILCVL